MYVLAEGAIATAAAEPRDSARMLVVRRSAPERVEHLVVRDLPGLLPAGMVMVRNVSRVLAAR
ncbi:MAG: tRNA preQ1(34) S-adenosylmethionine ribosyltransferase-isomerase QueA, partial [Isosphaera sp.]|nr:tRNA preQ1(34) S-adenosylmethionine ribosyltransferase-isomerase QueA [Isosphaera sp.]